MIAEWDDHAKSEVRGKTMWEVYACGCVSEFAATKEQLRGYCGAHGDNRRALYDDAGPPWIVMEGT